jgi:hypothetical protein
VKFHYEMIEGREAKDNFERGMKKLFRVPKSELKEQEKKYKERRKRKKS